MDKQQSRFFIDTNSLINPDEFLLSDINMYHYEVMDEGHHVWMGFYMSNGKVGHLNVFLDNDRISTRYEEFNNENIR